MKTLQFTFVGIRKAARGDWFFGPMGALFPWTHSGESKEVHKIYQLEEKNATVSEAVTGGAMSGCECPARKALDILSYAMPDVVYVMEVEEGFIWTDREPDTEDFDTVDFRAILDSPCSCEGSGSVPSRSTQC